jgi:phosphohistidine phosphatase
VDLYVVRHAIAEERDPAAWPDDDVRPLTERGIRRFRKAALGIERLVPTVDVMLASPKVRAWDTAVILNEEAGWPEPVACDALRESEPLAVLQALEAYSHLSSLAIVGHEPYLGRLLAFLLRAEAGTTFELRKGGAASLYLEGVSETSMASLKWCLTPKILRALA